MLDHYVAIDLEMTGLHPKNDRILEVAAVRIRQGVEVDSFSAVVNPKVPLSEKIIELTGITKEEAEHGAPLDETIMAFLDFLGEDILVGQNVIFDFSFLKQWAVNHKITFEKSAVDTLKLARAFLPPEQKKDLESLCVYFGVERVHAHRALEDVRETVQIFEKMKGLYGIAHEKDFEPKPLCYKAKKQTPATVQQLRYLNRLSMYHHIEIPELKQELSRSEASKLTDRLLMQYGKIKEE